MEIPEELCQRIDEAVLPYTESLRSAVLPVLHLLQEHYRFITPAAITWTASRLRLPAVQVLEVVTFYPGFRQSAPGKTHIRVCRTLSCAMAGGQEVMDKICALAGIDRSKADHHHPVSVSRDGKVSVEFVECLASCGSAPVCLVEETLYENLKPESVEGLFHS